MSDSLTMFGFNNETYFYMNGYRITKKNFIALGSSKFDVSCQGIAGSFFFMDAEENPITNRYRYVRYGCGRVAS